MLFNSSMATAKVSSNSSSEKDESNWSHQLKKENQVQKRNPLRENKD